MGCARLAGRLSVSGALTGSLAVASALTGTLTIAGSVPAYHGAAIVTPGDEAQTVPCAGLLMPQDIIIEAVPSHYGRIAWDGVSLSVS